MRSFSRGGAGQGQLEGSTRLVTGIAAAHGLRAEVDHLPGYPVTVNDDAEYAFAAATIDGPVRRGAVRPPARSRDWGRRTSRSCGAGAGRLRQPRRLPAATDPTTAPDNHSPRAHFDDSVVPDGAALLAELAVRRLAQLAGPAAA